jgi:hypothetical protein
LCANIKLLNTYIHIGRRKGSNETERTIKSGFAGGQKMHAYRDNEPGYDETQFFVPVVANKMKGYDSHLILKVYREPKDLDLNIQVIPNNTENSYLSFITIHCECRIRVVLPL